MIESLQAEGPLPDHADKLMLFGRLVGSWDIEARFLDEEGNVIRTTTGEWHFGWVLEGRAIQDVLITPSRRGLEAGERSRSYDTAIRAYDPRTNAWRVTVVAPIYGVTVNTIAREHDGEIWEEGIGPQGTPVRWTFSEFSQHRVLWRGFGTRDGGATWTREEEIVLRRRDEGSRGISPTSA
jgi:hypothetical protein